MLIASGLLSACLFDSSFESLDFQQGEKVVFLGNAFFENAFTNSEMETTIALSYPKKKITFRNIGWSGDNVYAHARTRARGGQRFGDPEKGFGMLRDQISALRPDKIFVAYGFNESFDDAGIDDFREGFSRLLDMLDEQCPKLILLSTLPMEHGFGIPTDHINTQNEKIEKCAGIIKDAARRGDHYFVDLFTPFSKEKGYTTNGIHLTARGYRKAGEIISEALDFPALVIDIDSDEAEDIRQQIIKKNTLFFHRWRPRNDAFVYGERKDEQRIAQEEPVQIEPFITKQESEITILLEHL